MEVAFASTTKSVDIVKSAKGVLSVNTAKFVEIAFPAKVLLCVLNTAMD